MEKILNILISGVILPISLVMPSDTTVIEPEMEKFGGIEESFTEMSTNTQRVYSKEEVKQIIRDESNRFGVDENLSLDTAEFESGFDPLIKNHEGSSARGVYQYIDKTWEDFCEGDRNNPVDNTRCFMKMVKEDNGIRHWTADPRTREYLIKKGYVECFEGENNCRLKSRELVNK